MRENGLDKRMGLEALYIGKEGAFEYYGGVVGGKDEIVDILNGLNTKYPAFIMLVDTFQRKKKYVVYYADNMGTIDFREIADGGTVIIDINQYDNDYYKVYKAEMYLCTVKCPSDDVSIKDQIIGKLGRDEYPADIVLENIKTKKIERYRLEQSGEGSVKWTFLG